MPVPGAARSLQEKCLQAVSTHFTALGTEAVLALPSPLITDLLAHLTVCQLDQVQPVLNSRGVSTFTAWFKILQSLRSFNNALKFNTEEKAKHEVLRLLFTLVLYGLRNSYVLRNGANLKNRSFLMTAAKNIQYFVVMPDIHRCLQTLTCDQRTLLTLLEKNIRRVHVSCLRNLSERSRQSFLYILHRLLDHGVATKLFLDVDHPIMLAWLLHRRGSQHVAPELKKLMPSCSTSETSKTGLGIHNDASGAEEDHVTPRKRFRLDNTFPENPGESDFLVDPHVLCQTFGSSAEVCSYGQIDSLELRRRGTGSLKPLSSALPTFFCLRSLTFHSTILGEAEVLDLAASLKKLSDSSCSSLTDLSLSILPSIRLMMTLVDAFPRLTSLSVEIQRNSLEPQLILDQPSTAESDFSELPLEKLTVKITEHQTDVRYLTSLLRRCPRLAMLQVAGLRPIDSTQSQLLTTLSESNLYLRFLNLEDMKLCGCLHEILNLLRICKLEELRLSDCRLFEKCFNQEESLRQLVTVLKTMPSLHKLGLAQNRLAKSVCELADLFSGPSPSPVKHLDISSNFILPADLMVFANRLRTHPPTQRLSLDLRKNPADRDLDTWTTALQRLQPAKLVLDGGWRSSDTMVDHVSNM